MDCSLPSRPCSCSTTSYWFICKDTCMTCMLDCMVTNLHILSLRILKFHGEKYSTHVVVPKNGEVRRASCTVYKWSIISIVIDMTHTGRIALLLSPYLSSIHSVSDQYSDSLSDYPMVPFLRSL